MGKSELQLRLSKKIHENLTLTRMEELYNIKTKENFNILVLAV